VAEIASLLYVSDLHFFKDYPLKEAGIGLSKISG
jgi:hypothetical protein